MDSAGSAQIFISYPRDGGEPFAEELQQRLTQVGFSVWRDRTNIKPGSDWWQQVDLAIRQAQFMLLVMTPASLQSKWMREEWRLARQEGVCVIPVAASPDLNFEAMPRWLRDMQFVNIQHPGEWLKLIEVLSCPCSKIRVPFMVEDLPQHFVERPDEFGRLIALLLDKDRENPVAITAALRGAGGYGKTTLARALCHDERIQQAFKHGILWVTLGQNPDNLIGKVEDLIYTLKGERPGFSSLEAATARLSELLDNLDILMVIDDVWCAAHLKPFLQGGKRCARLITTRNSDVLPATAHKINVDAMQPDEGTALLMAGLGDIDSAQAAALAKLAERLDEWPLLLKLVNSVLRERCETYRVGLANALEYVDKALKDGGVVAFDNPQSTEARDQAVAATMGLSLDYLQPRERQRYAELAVFPDNVDIPLAALQRLWGESATQVEQFCDRLSDLSLLLNFDAVTRRIRLHDVVRMYLRGLTPDRRPLHDRLLKAYPVARWSELPPDDPYLWDWLAYHLVEAGRGEELVQTARDLAYLTAKTHVRNAYAAEADIVAALKVAHDDTILHTLRRHFANAGHLLNSCPTLNDKRGTLHSRLIHVPELTPLCDALAHEMKFPYLTASHPLPDLPRQALIRTLSGHTGAVKDCEISEDGDFIVSASEDKTLKVWDAHTGCERMTLKGHTAEVNGCAVSAAAGIVVSASADKTLKVWDARTGQLRRTLTGHTASVSDCAIGRWPDTGEVFIVSASADKTLKVWDAGTGQLRRTLTGHSGAIYDCTISPDDGAGNLYILSASADKTLRLWDARTGQLRAMMAGHRAAVHGCDINADGTLLLSASHDRTVRVWDARTGEMLRILAGHNSVVDDCMFAGDAVVSASDDNTLKVWDWKTGVERFTLEGHTDWVNRCAVSQAGDLVVSASNDTTLKLWDVRLGAENPVGTGHTEHVYACAIGRWGETNPPFVITGSADQTLIVWDTQRGAMHTRLDTTMGGHTGWVRDCAIGEHFVVSVSDDRTLKVWDYRARAPRLTLRGHAASVRGCAIGPDYIVSASADGTLKVWEAQNGAVRHTLVGHTDWVNACAVSPDGSLILSASRDKTLKVWEAHSGRLLHTLVGHTSSVLACGFSPSGDLLISAASDGTLIVWDRRSFAKRATLQGHGSAVTGCAFSPSGEVIFSASADKTLRAWDVTSGQCRVTLHVDGPLRACAAYDNQVVAAGNRGVYFLRLMN